MRKYGRGNQNDCRGLFDYIYIDMDSSGCVPGSTAILPGALLKIQSVYYYNGKIDLAYFKFVSSTRSEALFDAKPGGQDLGILAPPGFLNCDYNVQL